MSAQEAFGPNLRRRRVREGISLEEIARHTHVSIEMWEAMERNDFSQWPSGISARAFIREYAVAIGVDPSEAVNDFCRWFPQGDRRAERLVRGTAEIVGHQLTWQDDLPHLVQRDRRVSSTDSNPPKSGAVRPVRLIAAALDLVAVVTASGIAVTFLPVAIWPALAGAAVLYHGVSLTVAGSTPAAWALATYLDTHPQFMRRAQAVLFRRLERPGKDESTLRRGTIS
jgi:transcriptional regulator with XRE-family HTH domain